MRMRSLPEKPIPNSSKRSAVRVMTQEAANSSPMRRNIASVRPRTRALFCCSGGSLPARMEMNTTLSMPSTISSTSRVANATSSSGVNTMSMRRILLTRPASRAQRGDSSQPSRCLTTAAASAGQSAQRAIAVASAT